MKALRIAYTFLILLLAGISASAQTSASFDSLTARYRLRLNGKDLREIVQTISVASTHSQSPTAKAVYTYCQSLLTTTTLTGDVTGSGTGTVATTISANAVDSTKLAASSVQSSDIRDGQVWKVDLAANVIDSTKIIAGAVQSSDIADGAVWRVDLAANAVDSTKLAASSVQSSDIRDGQVWKVDLAANVIDSTKIIAGAVQSSDIADGAVWRVDLAANAVDSTKLAASSVQSSDIRDGQVWKADIASNAVDSTKISNFGVSVFDIGQNGATTGQVLKWNGNMWLPSADNTGGGGGGGIDSTQANNGVSLSGKTVQLGGPAGSASAANFTADREIPTNSNKLIVSGVTKSVQVRGSNANNYVQISPDSTANGNAAIQIKTPSSASASEKYFLRVDPPTKNSAQSSLNFGVSNSLQTGVDGNNVFMFGWNVAPGGSKVEAKKAYIGESWEHNYRPDAPTAYPRYLEKHEIYMPSYNTRQRRLSSYTIIEGATGQNSIDLYHTTDAFKLRDTTFSDYFVASGNLSAASPNAQLSIYANRGSATARRFAISVDSSQNTITQNWGGGNGSNWTNSGFFQYNLQPYTGPNLLTATCYSGQFDVLFGADSKPGKWSFINSDGANGSGLYARNNVNASSSYSNRGNLFLESGSNSSVLSQRSDINLTAWGTSGSTAIYTKALQVGPNAGAALPTGTTLQVNSNAANTQSLIRLQSTTDSIRIFVHGATPEGATTGRVGDISIGKVSGTGSIYIKTLGENTNTGWTQVSTGGGGGSNYQTVQEEGSDLTGRSKLNFVGSTATATDDSGNSRTNVTFDSDVDALASVASTGLYAVTGPGTSSPRTLTAPAAGISITNGNGVSGNPTFSLANDLSAVEGLSGNGIAVRTATDTWTNRTITAGTGISITNGDGVSGNPTITNTGPTGSGTTDQAAFWSSSSAINASNLLTRSSTVLSMANATKLTLPTNANDQSGTGNIWYRSNRNSVFLRDQFGFSNPILTGTNYMPGSNYSFWGRNGNTPEMFDVFQNSNQARWTVSDSGSTAAGGNTFKRTFTLRTSVSSGGITYPNGPLYFLFWDVNIPASISVRYKSNSGTWFGPYSVTLTSVNNQYDPGNFDIYKAFVQGIGNDLRAIEVTMVSKAGTSINLQGIQYFPYNIEGFTSGQNYLINVDNTNTAQQWYSKLDGYYQGTATCSLSPWTNGDWWLNSGGKLAVGLSSGLSAQLQTKGSGATSSTYSLIATNSTGTTSTAALAVRDDSRVGMGTNAPTAKVQVQGEGTTSSTYPLIVTNSTGTTSTAALAVRDDGKIGIGTNAPAEVLDVTGQARVDALDIRDWSTTDNTNVGEVHFETGSGSTYGYLTVGDGERRFPITPTNMTFQAVDFDVAWTTGRTKAFWTVPAKYNGWKIYSVTLMVSTIGTGTNTIETEKGGVAQATTNITSASHVQVLDTALATDDIWTWDITAVSGTPTKGLYIEIILRHN